MDRSAHRRLADHRVGVGPPAAVALFAIFAAYAAVFALGAHGAESVWGAWAAGGYGAAAVVAAWSWRRHPGVSLLVALAGALAVPAAILPDNWGATSEVRVVARAAALSLAHGTPYLASAQLVSWRSYDPYLPGMSLFGLPHALGFPGLFGDPLTWMVMATASLLAAACRLAARGAGRRCNRCRYQALLRALFLLSCPVFALPMSLGVTDPPVIALICLGLAAAARRRRGYLLLSGAAIGAACALKATAWPALPVVVALVAARDGRHAAARLAGSSLGSFLMLTALTAPALLAQPGALWQNLVAYPLGLSRRLTPAASPLPGHVLAGAGSLGHLAAIVLLGGAALAMGASLVLRPPRDVQQASVRLAIGLAVMFLLAPDARVGYFAYPLGVLSWLVLTARLSWPRSQSHSLLRFALGSPAPIRMISTSIWPGPGICSQESSTRTRLGANSSRIHRSLRSSSCRWNASRARSRPRSCGHC